MDRTKVISEELKGKYAQRLKKLREQLNLSQRELAEIMKISFQSYWKQEKGKGVIRADSLANLAERLPNLNLTWLLTGKGPMFIEGLKETAEVISVEFYRDASLSAGCGNLPAELPPQPVYLSEAMCRKYFRVSPKGLVLFPVIGDSMQPTISEGAIAIVRKFEFEGVVFEGAIYALRYEGELYVKRVQKIPKGKNTVEWRLISDNHNYDPITFTLEPGTQIDFELIGRVIGYIARAK